jgi:hypothetical protein
MATADKLYKRGYNGAYGGVRRRGRLAEVWSQAVGFVYISLTGIGLSNRKFSH